MVSESLKIGHFHMPIAVDEINDELERGIARLLDNSHYDFFRFPFFTLAHLARCAAAILLRPAADMVCRLPRTFRDFVPSR